MTTLDTLRSLAQLELPALLVLLGPDQFLLHYMRQKILDRAVPVDLRSMNSNNYSVLDADGVKQALTSAQEYPCFSEKRFVSLNDIHKIKKNEGELLKNYLENPNPSCIFVLSGESWDGRSTWVRLCKQKATVLDVSKTTKKDALGWIENCFRKEKRKYEAGLPERLIELMGLDFGSLQQAVSQLVTYVGQPDATTQAEHISLAHCDELFERIPQENIFEVIDALFAPSEQKFYTSLQNLLSNHEAPLKILSLCHRHIAILLELKYLPITEQVMRTSDVDAVKGPPHKKPSMPPWMLKKYQQQVRSFGAALNLSLLQPLCAADRDLKSSRLAPQLILKKALGECRKLLRQ